MKKQYIAPEAICLCFAGTQPIAAIATINLIDSSYGLGSAATTSTTDIRIEINP